MAINQTEITLEMCSELVQAVNQFMDALDKIEMLQEQLEGAGIDLTAYEEELNANGGTKHCSPSTYKNILTEFAPHVVSDLKIYYSGSPTEQGWTAFQRARR